MLERNTHVNQNRRSLARLTPLVLGAIGATVLLGAVGVAQQGGPPPGRPAQPARTFKNLKVLKKMPPEDIIPTMFSYSHSLGVRCSFCHVVNPGNTGFELDTKPEKNVARKM